MRKLTKQFNHLDKKTKWILTGLGLAFLTFLVLPSKREKNLAFKSSLPAGTLLQSHHFSMKSTVGSSDYFNLADLPQLVGATVITDVREGEIVTREKIKLSIQNSGLSALIPKGLRAHTLLLQKIPPLRRGDYVDVFLPPYKGTGETSLIVERVKILEVRRVDSFFEVTLVLSPQEIEFLERARQKGPPFLVIRNPHENQTVRPKALTQSKKSSVKLWIEAP